MDGRRARDTLLPTREWKSCVKKIKHRYLSLSRAKGAFKQMNVTWPQWQQCNTHALRHSRSYITSDDRWDRWHEGVWVQMKQSCQHAIIYAQRDINKQEGGKSKSLWTIGTIESLDCHISQMPQSFKCFLDTEIFRVKVSYLRFVSSAISIENRGNRAGT